MDKSEQSASQPLAPDENYTMGFSSTPQTKQTYEELQRAHIFKRRIQCYSYWGASISSLLFLGLTVMLILKGFCMLTEFNSADRSMKAPGVIINVISPRVGDEQSGTAVTTPSAQLDKVVSISPHHVFPYYLALTLMSATLMLTIFSMLLRYAFSSNREEAVSTEVPLASALVTIFNEITKLIKR